MSASILPAEWEDHSTLDDLPVSAQVVYTVPWAMSVDLGGGCWLNPAYHYRLCPGGMVQMPVCRKSDGYYVWLTSEMRRTWSGWQRNGHAPGIPVVKVHTDA